MAGVRFWRLLAAVAAAVAVSAGLACTGSGETEGTIVINVSSPTPTPIPKPTATPTPTITPTRTPIPNVCGVNPDPAPPSVLQVEEPQPEERVGNPFHVRGWGSEIGVGDAGVAVALVDANGDPLPPKDAPPQPRAGRIAPAGLEITEFTAPFGTDIQVKGLTTASPFCIWVYVETTAEGIPQQVVQVPVIIAP